jgi:hypothetical protein
MNKGYIANNQSADIYPPFITIETVAKSSQPVGSWKPEAE